ncbi:MAG TPA: hypothetical protein VGC66_13785 [Pyrinomonadaceae bacterium]|jgi:hypothetical protein
MLKQFKFTLDCIVSIHDITTQDAERAYQDDPNIGCYLEEPAALVKVIEQQRRLLHTILQHNEVLHHVMRRYVYEYIQERLYDELPKPPEINEEMFLVMAEAIDALDFVDRALYLAYAAPRPEYELEEDGDPFEQHTRLIRESFKIESSRIDLVEVPFDRTKPLCTESA